MASTTLTLPVSDAVRRCTLQVRVRLTGQRLFALRLWLGTRLIRLAAFVLGCYIALDVEGR